MGLAMRLPGLSIYLGGLELTYTSIVCILMKRGDSTVHRRINVTLPEETVKLMDRVSEKGDRSQLINEAVNRYIGRMRRANLRKLLRAGALRRAARDRRLAEDWFLLEDDAWHRSCEKTFLNFLLKINGSWLCSRYERAKSKREAAAGSFCEPATDELARGGCRTADWRGPFSAGDLDTGRTPGLEPVLSGHREQRRRRRASCD